MVTNDDDNDVEKIKDFLKARGYISTLECLVKEHNYKKVEKKNKKDEHSKTKEDSFTDFIAMSRVNSRKLAKLQEAYSLLDRKYRSILQCARMIFSIAVNCLELLSKQGKSDSIENYKTQIGKYHKILMTDEWDERTQLITQAVITEHKKKLIKAKSEHKNEDIIEVLLSLRVNALQMIPELRRNLVDLFVEDDILNLQSEKSNQFVLDLLNIHEYNPRHAILSVISIIASTSSGVEYLTKFGVNIAEKIIEIMKLTEDGQVLQRFCIAILQKMSILENTMIPIYLKYGLIDWLTKLLQRSENENIHIFCLDFASALLANILHSSQAIKFLEENIAITKNLTETFLSMIKKEIPTSVLMHLLICLSNLNKEALSSVIEECKFDDSIKEFLDYYKGIKAENENDELIKETVLGLAENLFHSKKKKEVKETKESKNDDRIHEFEKNQGPLVFECFQDEIV